MLARHALKTVCGSARLLGAQQAAALSATPARHMSEMSFTFAAPNAVLYNGANIKQVSEVESQGVCSQINGSMWFCSLSCNQRSDC